MSLQSVQNIIGKAAVDRVYRDLLFSNPDEALRGFELSADEISQLKALSRETFDAAAGELEAQILEAVGGASGPQMSNEQLLPAVRQFDLGRFGMYDLTN